MCPSRDQLASTSSLSGALTYLPATNPAALIRCRESVALIRRSRSAPVRRAVSARSKSSIVIASPGRLRDAAPMGETAAMAASPPRTVRVQNEAPLSDCSTRPRVTAAELLSSQHEVEGANVHNALPFQSVVCGWKAAITVGLQLEFSTKLLAVPLTGGGRFSM